MNRIFVTALLLMPLVGSRAVLALDFEAPIDQSNWAVVSSPLECRLQHQIPSFGSAEFVQSAGAPMKFRMQSVQGRLRKGKALLAVETPAWKDATSEQLGMISVISGRNPVRLDEVRSQQVLDILQRGNTLALIQGPAAGHGDQLRVALSAVNFRSGHRAYMDCLAAMSPVSFAQIEKSVLRFGGQQARVSPAGRERLDLIARYVQSDPGIGRLFVDGHADSQGRAADNRRLSRQRAYAVSAYLIEKGVSEDMITTRYHGERYPVASNASRKGRDRNRRVSVRLELRDPSAGLASRESDQIQPRPRFDARM